MTKESTFLTPCSLLLNAAWVNFAQLCSARIIHQNIPILMPIKATAQELWQILAREEKTKKLPPRRE